jgi:hypothetical protein
MPPRTGFAAAPPAADDVSGYAVLFKFFVVCSRATCVFSACTSLGLPLDTTWLVIALAPNPLNTSLSVLPPWPLTQRGDARAADECAQAKTPPATWPTAPWKARVEKTA